MVCPREMLSPVPRDALLKAQGYVPPGVLSLRPKDALSNELCLPSAATRSSGCPFSVWQPGSLPERGSRARRGGRGTGGCPIPLPATSPLHTLTPPLAHAFGCIPWLLLSCSRDPAGAQPPPQSLVSCSPLTPARGSVHALTISVVKLGALHDSGCHKRVAAPSPPWWLCPKQTGTDGVGWGMGTGTGSNSSARCGCHGGVSPAGLEGSVSF